MALKVQYSACIIINQGKVAAVLALGRGGGTHPSFVWGTNRYTQSIINIQTIIRIVQVQVFARCSNNKRVAVRACQW